MAHRRVARIADYSRQLAEFHDWVRTEVDAQANYTDRYAPPALETYDRNGDLVNRIVSNRWYEEQHRDSIVAASSGCRTRKKLRTC